MDIKIFIFTKQKTPDSISLLVKRANNYVKHATVEKVVDLAKETRVKNTFAINVLECR